MIFPQQSIVNMSLVTLITLLSSLDGNNAFMPTTQDVFIHHHHQATLNKHKIPTTIPTWIVQRKMSIDSSSTETMTNTSNDTSPSDDDKKNNHALEWWQTVELNDSKLASTVRNDFPILTFTKHFNDNNDKQEQGQQKQLIYFDSAATSQKPNQVIDKLSSYYNRINSNVHRGAHTLSQRATTEYEAARDKVKTFINANSRNEIIFTSGATEAINLVAATYGRANIQEGDEILISELEHHSNIVPWQMLAEEKGAVLKFIPIDTEKQCLNFDNETLDNLITSKTKIVSIQHVSNVLACIHPIETLVAKVKERASSECKIILDACQSIPHMPVDVQSLGVDFIAASGHKMCAPTGIGFLWGKEDILNSMPPYMGGGEMIDEVYMTHSTFALAPARFEAGTPPIAQAIGLGAAIDYLNSVGGIERVHKYEQELGEYLLKRMKEVEGITVLGPELGVDRAAIVAFVCDDVHPSDLSTFLDMEGVAIRAGHHCCQPLHRALGYSHSARASLYFYNTKEEIDSFISILRETLSFLGGATEAGLDDDFVPFI
jgi:cysteine desulfurase/selenocysteine lyase